jgi:hypothetical protein
VRRRWNDGTLLRALVSGESFPVIDVPLRGPVAADLGEHFDAARAWADSVRRASRAGRAFDVVDGRIGGRLAGTSEVPVRAVLTSYEQAWQLLGTAVDAATYRELVDTTQALPRARQWALNSPLVATALAPEWSAVLAACAWLDTHRDSGLFLRQVSAAGVDTKFIEQHRGVLAGMLGVPAGKGVFERALGLATKPTTVRLRFDPDVLGAPNGVTEAVFRTGELRRLDVRARRAMIVENEITYLSVPVPPGGIVLWGKGYDADEAASLEWLADIEVDYWGDIDTHGFSILNRVRTRLPHTQSLLMDRETLLAHETRWVHEGSPTNIALPGLHADESALYSELVTDRYGPGIRLEQERVDWQWVAGRLG